MPGITLKNGLISYYGNPAGYTEKEKAVVDSIFRNDELTNWLKSRSLTPQWTDGVMERLAAGEQMGGMAEAAAPLKSVRIWQLKPDTDVYRQPAEHEKRGLCGERHGNWPHAGFLIPLRPLWYFGLCGGSHQLRQNHRGWLGADHRTGQQEDLYH